MHHAKLTQFELLRKMLNDNKASTYLKGHGRSIAQVVSRSGSSPGQVMWDLWWKCGTGPGFLRVLRFPLPIIIPPTAAHSSSSITRCWYNRPVSGRRTKWPQSHPTPRNKKKLPEAAKICRWSLSLLGVFQGQESHWRLQEYEEYTNER
jgi:hypothetical protein